jgi:hypothetical protein
MVLSWQPRLPVFFARRSDILCDVVIAVVNVLSDMSGGDGDNDEGFGQREHDRIGACTAVFELVLRNLGLRQGPRHRLNVPVRCFFCTLYHYFYDDFAVV